MQWRPHPRSRHDGDVYKRQVVPSKALWDYGTREHLEGIDLILSCGDLPQKYLEYLTRCV